MAQLCDSPGCGGKDDVQKIVFMVVSGESTQCHGDLCLTCRAALPGKLEALGLTLSSGENPARRRPMHANAGAKPETKPAAPAAASAEPAPPKK